MLKRGISGKPGKSGLSGMSGASGQLLPQGGYLLPQGSVLGFEAGNNLALRLALPKAGSRHALADATFGGEFTVATLDVFRQGCVHLMAEANGHVAKFLVGHRRQQGTVILPKAVLAAEAVQTLEPRVLPEPFLQTFALQVVAIVLEQLLIAAAADAQQFQLRFGGRLAVGAPLGNVLP